MKKYKVLRKLGQGDKIVWSGYAHNEDFARSIAAFELSKELGVTFNHRKALKGMLSVV